MNLRIERNPQSSARDSHGTPSPNETADVGLVCVFPGLFVFGECETVGFPKNRGGLFGKWNQTKKKAKIQLANDISLASDMIFWGGKSILMKYYEIQNASRFHVVFGYTFGDHNNFIKLTPPQPEAI